MHLSFVNDCLIKRKADLFYPIKKINLDIGLKKTKKILKGVSVMKEDKEPFGVMLGEEVNLKEAFWYPVLLVPLSLTFPDSTYRQDPKHLFP